MTLAMGLLSLGGTYAYQRGMAVVLATRNELEHQGVPRSAIDAGYALNGEDLYRYPKHGIEAMELEAGIPMITSPKRVISRSRANRSPAWRSCGDSSGRARSAWAIDTFIW